MAITEKEEEELRNRIREELQKKEEERFEAIEELKNIKDKDNFKQKEINNRNDEIRRIEIAEDEKRKYYKERGYIPVKDRAGNVYWLSKDEYEEKKHRIKAKHSSKKSELEIKEGAVNKSSNYLFIGLLAFILIAILISLIASFLTG